MESAILSPIFIERFAVDVKMLDALCDELTCALSTKVT